MNDKCRIHIPAEDQEKFEQFVFEMDDVLEDFVSGARHAGFALDYSMESLDVFERYLAAVSKGSQDSETENRAARYLGEVFRKNIGGQWELCAKGPNYLFFKLPVIGGYSDRSTEFCPIEVLGNFLQRMQPGMLRRAVESHRVG